MRRYLYNYQTIIHFSAPVIRHFFRLRCMPCDNACQKHTKRDLFLHPADYLAHDRDGWGNPIQYGYRLDNHDSFVYVSSGEVTLAPYLIPTLSTSEIFKTPSTLTWPSPAMKEWASGPVYGRPLDKALYYSEKIYNYMMYTPGSTRQETTAAEAFAQRMGVCQDYAHILISLCRNQGIAARYANGFLPGIGETHAWVEILDGGEWHGIDPTNNTLIEYGYVKLSHGRDATDCPVNRGIFTGVATQRAEIRVIVEEL